MDRDALVAELTEFEESLLRDVDAALKCAVAVERLGAASGDTRLQRRGELLRAMVHMRQPETLREANHLLLTVNAWAAEQGERYVLARSHHLLARVALNIGDLGGLLEHSIRCVELLEPDASSRIRVIHLIMLGEALARTGSPEAAFERFRLGERIALAAGDALFRAYVLNNLAYHLLSAGHAEQAWSVAQQLAAVIPGHSQEPQVLDTLARIEIALGHYEQARDHAEESVRLTRTIDNDYCEGLADSSLTLAAAQRHLGAYVQAQAILGEVLAATDGPDLARMRVAAIGEQAELHAARGEFQAAYEAYKAFHEAAEQLSSRQREEQARMRLSLFEVAEARQDAERFREQAHRDVLTGLHNRRHVGEQLPGLLATSAATGSPLIAALLDLDHFKRINDTCGHDAGDKVLVAFADLLAAAVPDGRDGAHGLAARIGGEEFLFVLTGMSPAASVFHLEDLRRTVAGHDWTPITGDLPITVSIGATMAGPGSTEVELLRRADESLYTAKHEGRDRVCVDPVVDLADRRALPHR